MKYTVYLFIFSLLIISGCKEKLSKNQFEITKNNYLEYCAGCHGFQMETFVNKDNWTFGESEAELFNTIKYGQTNIGMPGYDTTFTDEEIRLLTQFILYDGKKEFLKEEPFDIPTNRVIQSEKRIFTLDTVISGLHVPWGMTWLPNGDMLITERSGTLYRLSDGKLNIIENTPNVYAYGQGGLLDIELHPNYKENGWIYVSYSYYAGVTLEEGGSTAIMRCRLENDKLIDKEILFKAVPTEMKGQHFGSRIEFDADNRLYFSVGDRGQRENAQKISNHSGCMHRLMDDGTIPPDNPFIDVPDAIPSIYNYGHRNIQGLAIHPTTGKLWSHEHGPKGGDELNLEESGKNYGWPEITFGINYNGTIITEDTAKLGMEQPVAYWIPSIAPCGMEFVEGNTYPSWENNLLIGSLRFQYLVRCEMENEKIIHQEILLEGIGRVRNVKQGPDGYIYVAIETPGKILIIVPE